MSPEIPLHDDDGNLVDHEQLDATYPALREQCLPDYLSHEEDRMANAAHLSECNSCRFMEMHFAQQQAHEMLKGAVNVLDYAVEYRTGVVYMPKGGRVSMRGAVNFFTRIDPKVATINMVIGLPGRFEPDSFCNKAEGGGWQVQSVLSSSGPLMD